MHAAKGAAVGGIIGGRILRARVAVDQVVEAYDALLAGIGYDLDLLAVARLEAHGCRGGDIEVHAEGCRAVELQVAVDLEEVEVRAHLYGAVARVADGDGSRAAAGVVLDVLLGQYHAPDDGLRLGHEALACGIQFTLCHNRHFMGW